MYKKFILAKKLDKVMQFCCKYTVDKAHDIHTEGVVQIFDMKGKFCNKAK
ncbi:hypothetical protein [Candidatus Tisiphia endosymbiont of Micropterix aruncella]